MKSLGLFFTKTFHSYSLSFVVSLRTTYGIEAMFSRTEGLARPTNTDNNNPKKTRT